MLLVECVCIRINTQQVMYWYRLFEDVCNIHYIFHTIVLYTYITPYLECYMNLEYSPVATRVVLTLAILG